MSKSRRLSNASAVFRRELPVSRWQAVALSLLAALSVLSVLASDLPRWQAWALALLATAQGIWMLHRQRCMPADRLCISADGRQATCNGVRMEALQLRWRGALAFLVWREGRGWRRLVLWPDVLDAAARRELELVMRQREAAEPAASMAG